VFVIMGTRTAFFCRVYGSDNADYENYRCSDNRKRRINCGGSAPHDGKAADCAKDASSKIAKHVDMGKLMGRVSFVVVRLFKDAVLQVVPEGSADTDQKHACAMNRCWKFKPLLSVYANEIHHCKKQKAA
jgi:hypothetical protein